MKRTKPAPDIPPVYNVNDEPIVLSKPLLDLLLQQDNYSQLIALYTFYYYTAKWQQTNQPKATTSYTAKALRWHGRKVQAVKQQLMELKLIENITTRNEKNRITGHYVKVNFIWSRDTVNSTPQVLPPVTFYHPWQNRGGNALSTININALSTINNNYPRKNNPKKSSNKPSIQERNTQFIPLTEQLSSIIQTNKSITHNKQQIKSWANELRKLHEGNKISIERMQKTLDWYEDNIGGQYIPVIESGDSFRQKFIRLEDAMGRANTSHNKYRSGRTSKDTKLPTKSRII